jgi:hypothetical protein
MNVNGEIGRVHTELHNLAQLGEELVGQWSCATDREMNDIDASVLSKQSQIFNGRFWGQGYYGFQLQLI